MLAYATDKWDYCNTAAYSLVLINIYRETPVFLSWLSVDCLKNKLLWEDNLCGCEMTGLPLGKDATKRLPFAQFNLVSNGEL